MKRWKFWLTNWNGWTELNLKCYWIKILIFRKKTNFLIPYSPSMWGGTRCAFLQHWVSEVENNDTLGCFPFHGKWESCFPCHVSVTCGMYIKWFGNHTGTIVKCTPNHLHMKLLMDIFPSDWVYLVSLGFYVDFFFLLYWLFFILKDGSKVSAR